jgi:hypothetical protein
VKHKICVAGEKEKRRMPTNAFLSKHQSDKENRWKDVITD